MTPTSCTQSELTCACRLGDVYRIDELLSSGIKPDADSLDAAIDSGIEFAVELIQLYNAIPTVHSLNRACETKNCKIVEMTIKAKALPSPDTFTRAILMGNLEIVQLVQKTGAKPDENSLGAALSVKMFTMIMWIIEQGGRAQAGVLTRACSPLHPIKDWYINDAMRDEIIIAITQAGGKPDDQTLIDFLVNSLHSHISGDQELFCHPNTLTALEKAGIRCTGSEQETACVLDCCLKLDTDCREAFCQFLINIGFNPSPQQLQTHFHDQIGKLQASLLAVEDNHLWVKANIEAKLMRAAITLSLLDKAYFAKHGTHLIGTSS